MRIVYPNLKCPCMNCTDRHIACHCECEKYKEFKKQIGRKHKIVEVSAITGKGLDDLKKAGVDHIVVVVGHGAEQIQNYLKDNKYNVKGSIVVETIKGENMEDMNNKLQDYLIELQAKGIDFDIININQSDIITASKSIERNSLIFGEFLEYGGTVHYHQYTTTIIIKIK